MLFLRSLVFQVALYGYTTLQLVLAWPYLLRPWPARWGYVRFWARVVMWLHRVICGTRVEVRGREHMPAGGFLVASKHQSMWETVALVPLFPFTTFILKQELMSLPIFGWAMNVTGMIPIDRGGGVRAMLHMTARAKAAIEDGRQVVIFPEGTRQAPGAPPDYKTGAGFLYESCNAPCLPVALDSGLFWPRGSFLRHPGTIVVEFLPPIPPGLNRRAFMSEVERRIEGATAKLLAEAAAAPGAPPAAAAFRPDPTA